ncbi:hypothetical protein [Conexibacter woesei]|uniref:Uncharacterized protein n=1 Tax=Conexibacter woesei (strain DSM 14684 / CCUG 47730 / CIP 108061 / JCM 11494 / NBRC 100937 / ID131577) TaxID=469383 RepID=D3FB30_CONWI|nr:hypothetical protein [Conexibacter woesei]ADB53222.1 hypothetical protein Cwoe_4809 [Conexibacter woesei DSM 14684]
MSLFGKVRTAAAALAAAVALTAIVAGDALARAGAPRLVTIGRAPGRPYFDGRDLLWRRADGGAVVLDPRTGARHALPIEAGCAFERARRPGFALLGCAARGADEEGRLVVVRTGDGAQVFEGTIPGSIVHWGDHWVQTFYNAGCYHCDSTHYLNWRTGERRDVDWLDEVPVDLNAPDLRLRPARRPTPAERSAPRLVRQRSSVVLVRGRTRRTVGRCRIRCDSLALWRGRASWIDPGSFYGEPGWLHEVDVRSARRWRWRLEASTRGPDDAGLVEHRALRLRGTLVVISWYPASGYEGGVEWRTIRRAVRP